MPICLRLRVRAEVSNGIRADLAKLGGDSVLVHPFPRHHGFRTHLKSCRLAKNDLESKLPVLIPGPPSQWQRAAASH